MLRNQTFVNGKGTLYLIATPIGNLSDISPRVIETLNKVSYLACEDTRNTGKLLEHLNIKKKLVSYHKFNEREMVDSIIESLNNGEDVGVVSDAGYPGISDPGQIVSHETIKEGFNVTCIGGPSAFIHALVCSGFDTSHFYFYGFLDSKEVARKKQLESLKNIKDTIIFYETSNRMIDCLKDMNEVFGNRKFCIARELTKKFEECIYGELNENFNLNDLKGECVLVVEGKEDEVISIDNNIKEVIEDLLKKNVSAKDISKILSKVTNISKNELYEYIVKKD